MKKITRKIFVLFILMLVIITTVSGCGKAETGMNDEEIGKAETGMSDEEIIDALLKSDYNVGYFSISIGEVLDKCAQYEASVFSYEEKKTEYLNENGIASMEAEDSQFFPYLSTSYFVSIDGKILQNPEVEHYYSAEGNILTAFLVFDENQKLLGCTIVKKSESFNTCATLLCVD